MSSHGQVKYAKQSVCTNCGELGHHFRNCTAPVTSYGIIAFRVQDSQWNQAAELAKSDSNLTGISDSNLQLLLIQRRDSIGYVELLRAKYKLSDVEYIKKQIAGITAAEREKILTLSFHDLWFGLWGTNASETRQYKQEYDQAKLKFESLQTGYDLDGTRVSFTTLFEQTPVQWDTPEWGFPKGRRNTGESDYACAIREFNEETNLKENQYRILENIEPLRETFFGNNGIHYRHIYYLAWIPSNIKIELNHQNEHMHREVGGIGWFSLEDALKRIRPTNVEKREVLLRVSSILRNTCAFLVGPVAEVAEQSAQKEADGINRRQRNECSNPWQQQRLVRTQLTSDASSCSNSTHSTSSGQPSTLQGITERRAFSFVEHSE